MGCEMGDLSNAVWFKSSRSGGQQGGSCVEIALNVSGVVGVRDSKDRAGGHLAVKPTAWADFLSEVTSGRIDV